MSVGLTTRDREWLARRAQLTAARDADHVETYGAARGSATAAVLAVATMLAPLIVHTITA